MKLLCKTCNKLKQDTNFNFIDGTLELDVSKCQLCINPHMNDEVRVILKKRMKEMERDFPSLYKIYHNK